MLWDPCGHVVAFGRRPYWTKARPFRDSTETREIDWYIVPDDAPPLPFSSALNSLDDQETRLWYEDQWHNEDPLADRIYNGQGPFPCAGAGHVCGEKIDFEQGGLFPGSAPAPPVDINGIPLCCNPCIVPQGGGVGGGVLIPIPPPPTPGTSCLDAPVMAPDDAIYDYHLEPGESDWFAFEAVNGAEFHVEIQRDPPILIQCSVYNGSCPGPTFLFFAGIPGCNTFQFFADETIWFQISNPLALAVDYTIQFGPGPC